MSIDVTVAIEKDKLLEFIAERIEVTRRVLDMTDLLLDNSVEALKQSADSQGDVRHALIYLDNFQKELSSVNERVASYMTLIEGHVIYQRTLARPTAPAPGVTTLERMEKLAEEVVQQAEKAVEK